MGTTLSYTTKSAAVVAALREDILGGALPPGTALQQEEIAHRLGVSSTPVREAFGVLQAEGLLQLRPHRGVIVSLARPVSPSEAEAIYRVRGVIEETALKRLAEGHEPNLLDALEEVVGASESARRAKDFVGYRHCVSEFHRVLARATGSPLLTSVLHTLSAHSQFFVTGLSNQGLRQSQTRHKAMIGALRMGDSKAALSHADHHLAEHLADLEALDPPVWTRMKGAERPPRIVQRRSTSAEHSSLRS